MGQDWAIYTDSYRAGWERGCSAGRTWIRNQRPRDEPDPTPLGACGNAPESPNEFSLPTSPPDDPQTAGVEDGVTNGCAEAFREADEDDDRPCYLTAVLLNARNDSSSQG